MRLAMCPEWVKNKPAQGKELRPSERALINLPTQALSPVCPALKMKMLAVWSHKCDLERNKR